MTDTRNAAVLGASGLVGGCCIRALLSEQDYTRIILLNRRELSGLSDPRLHQKVIDFENLTLADFSGVDDVFCSLGTTIGKAGSQEAFRRVDRDYPLAAAKAALQAGARQFLLVSSVGADAGSKNFYLRTKGELEEELKKLGFAALHIFRPSLLLGRREEFRMGERIMMPLAPALNLLMLGGLRRYRAISAAEVGKAMAAAAKRNGLGVFIYHYGEIRSLAHSYLDHEKQLA